MNDVDIKFEGLESLMEDLKKAEEKVPYVSQEILIKGMRKCKSLSKQKTPVTNGDHKHLKDKYKVLDVEYNHDGMSIKMTNKSQIFHLIERGHRIVTKSGVEKGWYEGKHMVERSVMEMEEIFPKIARRHIKKILK